MSKQPIHYIKKRKRAVDKTWWTACGQPALEAICYTPFEDEVTCTDCKQELLKRGSQR